MAPAALLMASVLGLALAWAVMLRARPVDDDSVAYLRALDAGEFDELDDYQQKLQEPILNRLLRPLAGSAGSTIGSLTPRAQLDRIHAKLLQSGLGSTIRAEEFATLQVVLAGAVTTGSLLLAILVQPSIRYALLLVLGVPLLSLLAPQAWLERKVGERKDLIRADLPDALDLMAIAVEAGTGFEGAVAVVCENFNTPLGIELSRMLKEMELGLSRREALQNLRRRTDVPELSGFVVAIIQADALGMPVGRVLKTQAVEMRSKRRAWAREKAGKLPVKIMFPLVFFIFPAILIITLYPAAVSMVKNL